MLSMKKITRFFGVGLLVIALAVMPALETGSVENYSELADQSESANEQLAMTGIDQCVCAGGGPNFILPFVGPSNGRWTM